MRRLSVGDASRCRAPSRIQAITIGWTNHHSRGPGYNWPRKRAALLLRQELEIRSYASTKP